MFEEHNHHYNTQEAAPQHIRTVEIPAKSPLQLSGIFASDTSAVLDVVFCDVLQASTRHLRPEASRYDHLTLLVQLLLVYPRDLEKAYLGR